MIKNLPSHRQITLLANVRFSVRRFGFPHIQVQPSQRMLAVLSQNSPSNGLGSQNIARQQRISKGIRLLRRKINRAIHTERENAVIYRLFSIRSK